MTLHPSGLYDDAVAIEVGDVDREPHADRVHPPAGSQYERPSRFIASEEPSAAFDARLGEFCRGHHAGVVHQPGHAQSVSPARGALTVTAGARSDVEAELHHVAIAGDVVLAPPP